MESFNALQQLATVALDQSADSHFLEDDQDNTRNVRGKVSYSYLPIALSVMQTQFKDFSIGTLLYSSCGYFYRRNFGLHVPNWLGDLCKRFLLTVRHIMKETWYYIDMCVINENFNYTIIIYPTGKGKWS